MSYNCRSHEVSAEKLRRPERLEATSWYFLALILNWKRPELIQLKKSSTFVPEKAMALGGDCYLSDNRGLSGDVWKKRMARAQLELRINS